MRRAFNPSGLLIALLGFILTRATVTFAATDTPTTFLVGGILPLVLGLSLSAFGVVLTIGAFETAFVRTVVRWTLMGAGFIGVLVLVSVIGVGRTVLADGRAATLFSNVLIGGSVGGALLGGYAARNRTYQQELLHRQTRLVILNRLLLDEVMNAVTVIKGSVPLLKEDASPEVPLVDAIHEKAERIEEVMDVVRDLAEPDRELPITSMTISEVVDDVLTRARAAHPEVTFSAERVPDAVEVRATPRLADALFRLLADGAERATAEQPHVSIEGAVRSDDVVLSVIGEGQVLSTYERDALERGTTIATDDDPTPNLGFYLTRLLVQAARGTLAVDEGDSDTRISIVLDRAAAPNAPAGDAAQSQPERVGIGELATIGLAALFAGGVMGAYVHLTAGKIPVIGALYGTETVIVGLLTHEFHSVVFGFLYGAFLVVLPARYTRGSRRVGVSATWSVLLWLVASGFVMSIWLNLVGIETPLPKLGTHDLIAHLIWGLTLGVGDCASRAWGLPDWVGAVWETGPDRGTNGGLFDARGTPTEAEALHSPNS